MRDILYTVVCAIHIIRAADIIDQWHGFDLDLYNIRGVHTNISCSRPVYEYKKKIYTSDGYRHVFITITLNDT